MFIVAIVSVSGGVGRTTLAANLAAIISKRGRPVLVIEWDPANRLGLHLGTRVLPEDGWVSEVIRGGAWHERAYRNSDGVDFLPFGQVRQPERICFEQQLGQDQLWLDRQLRNIDFPDEALVLIDVANGPSIYMSQALAAAGGALAVITPSPSFALEIDALEDELTGLLEFSGKKLPVNYLLNRLDPTRRLSFDMSSMLRSRLNEQLLRYMLHQDEAIPEALASNLSVTDYAPDSQANHDLQGIASWLLDESATVPALASL